jgi:predicted dehydrogenase
MSRFSRRLFLQESLLATTAIAAGSRGVLAAAETAPQSASPNERLSVAVIGVRGRGGDHAKAFSARQDCAVTYICDADSQAGGSVAERFESKPKFVADMRRIFDDPSVDIVSIATPNHWHSLAAIWAMQAGKDVYVEKPVSHNVSEGRRMVQASRKHNRICQGGTQHRSAGANRAAAEYVRAGKLGQVKLAHVCTYRLRTSIGPAGEHPVPESVDYNLWAGPAPMELPLRRKTFHYDWHWFWDWGNGELGNNSVHAVDTMRMIVDLKGLGRGVMSYGGRVGIDDCAETPSVQVTIHDFDPITVVQEVRNLKTGSPRRGGAIFIEGTDGYLVSNYSSASVYDPDGKLREELKGPNLDHFDNFVQAVRSRNRDAQNAEILQGHTSTAVVHVANISQRLGKTASPAEIQKSLESLHVNENVVETFAEIRQHLADHEVDIEKTPLSIGPWIGIDSDKEQFVDNPAANAMLTREYRAPFVVPAENEV